MDAPTGSFGPNAAGRIAELLLGLRGARTIVIIAQAMEAARRVADRLAFLHLGRLFEAAPTGAFLADPRTPQARRLVTRATG